MSIQNQNCKILFMCFLFPMLVMVSCSLPKPTQSQTKQKPGLTYPSGWNNAFVSGDINVFYGIDIEGKVGYRLEVSGPRANCVSPSNKWTGNIKIVSGQLPPGMDFDGFDIKGIPTKRGNYIVVLELYNIKCNDTNYGSKKQELRFHIGGVGIVNG